MSQNEGKRLSGEKAAEYVTDGSIVGVGTGSTVAFFIQALGRMKHRIEGAVSSSEQSTRLLTELGFIAAQLPDFIAQAQQFRLRFLEAREFIRGHLTAFQLLIFQAQEFQFLDLRLELREFRHLGPVGVVKENRTADGAHRQEPGQNYFHAGGWVD